MHSDTQGHTEPASPAAAPSGDPSSLPPFQLPPTEWGPHKVSSTGRTLAGDPATPRLRLPPWGLRPGAPRLCLEMADISTMLLS